MHDRILKSLKNFFDLSCDIVATATESCISSTPSNHPIEIGQFARVDNERKLAARKSETVANKTYQQNDMRSRSFVHLSKNCVVVIVTFHQSILANIQK